MPLMRLLHRIVHLRTSPQPLAIARIMVGFSSLFAALEAWRALPRILRPLIVKIPFLPWLPLLPSGTLPLFIAAWLLAALLFIIGWQTRIAGTIVTLATGYALFLDEQLYSNHLYLLFVILLLLTIADSGAAWSLDARSRREQRDVAEWPILLLKIQISVVYVFSALAKITPQYLAGESLNASLRHAWRFPIPISAIAAASIAIELFIGFGLWSRRVRPFAIIAGIAFHALILALVDSSRLSLGIFALEIFAVYVLFAKETAA